MSGLVGVTFISSLVAKRQNVLHKNRLDEIVTVHIFTASIILVAPYVYTSLAIAGINDAGLSITDGLDRQVHRRETHGSASGFVGLISRIISVAMLLTAPSFINDAALYLLSLYQFSAHS